LDNAFWDHYDPEICVDIVSGQPLFSSLGKIDCDVFGPRRLAKAWPSAAEGLCQLERIVKPAKLLEAIRR
jgi:peptide methionine sulfoxide reductase MsrB